VESVLSAEGSIALAISALTLVLGWRFTLPERGRDFAGILVFAAAIAVTFAAGRELIPHAGAVTPGPATRLAGGALLVAGLMLSGASFRARLVAGRGRLVEGGPYARVRQPLYLGLGLALVGHLLRLPSQVGTLATAIALVQYIWLATVREREARASFGRAWEEYAARTPAVLPLPRRGR
jgi:protein-S-isoprenylcysteine O-methyltransferase Ste14